MFLNRFFLAGFLLILSVTAVNAYTVVMRDGRRVEIPNEFTVTNSALTYDVGNDIQITIQLNAVDVAATERLNGESQGSLLQRATATPDPVLSGPQTPRANRTITNANLEKYRLARVENENQRRELGLPSVEDRQQEVAAIEDRTLDQVRSMRAQEEAYWRSRAEALRAETAAGAAQFESFGRSANDFRQFDSFGSFLPFDGVGFGITGGRFNRFGRFQSSPFSGFLATPITPFPTFRSNRRPVVFAPPRARINFRHGPRR